MNTQPSRPELDPQLFRKASNSGNLGCVEVALAGVVIGVRDSKDQAGAVLAFTPHEWRTFIAAVKAGEFDIA
jgi:ABC-type amino acid transport substrate-binding protein